MKVMATTQAKNLPFHGPRQLAQKLRSFFRWLQWKLTLAYTLFTVVTIIILGLVGLALLWYLYFWSNWLPMQVADALIKARPFTAPYLEQASPDQEGLSHWLQEVIADGNLVINIPTDENAHDSGKLPANFDPVVFIAIAAPNGQTLAGYGQPLHRIERPRVRCATPHRRRLEQRRHCRAADHQR